MKNKQMIPGFDHFLSYLKVRTSLEKEIAIMQNKVDYHCIIMAISEQFNFFVCCALIRFFRQPNHCC